MRFRQPTWMFSFTILVGLVRVFAYAGSPIGRELSVAVFVHAVGLHVLTFTFAAFLVVALSRATATRAAMVALYAQAVLLLGAFVDAGLGLVVSDYARTYTGVFGGTIGSILAVLAYGGILGWGVHDATIGRTVARISIALLAGAGGVVGVSFLAIPWPGIAFSGVPGWSVHLSLAVYYTSLAALFLCLGLNRANPGAFRWVWRRISPARALGFAILPLVGVVTAERLIVPQVQDEPVFRLLVEVPYVLAGAACAVALWVQWRFVRVRELGPLRLEAAAVAKVVALAFALPLGIAPFLAAALSASLAWLGRAPRYGLLVGVLGSSAFLVGNLTVVAVSFAAVSLGPAIFLAPVDQAAGISLEGGAVAAAIGVLVALVSHVTNRTSASGRGRVSS